MTNDYKDGAMNDVIRVSEWCKNPVGKVFPFNATERCAENLQKALEEIALLRANQNLAPAGVWMREFVDAIEREAFKMSAPNTHTPILVGFCMEARRRLVGSSNQLDTQK